MWVERLANGNYALQVHIADVSHYVRPGTPIDREAAAARHQRLFSRSRRAHAARGAFHRPMLAPAARRPPGASALLEIDPRGDVVRQDFTRGMIRSAERMTYTAVHGVLEGDAALRDRYRRWSRASS